MWNLFSSGSDDEKRQVEKSREAFDKNSDGYVQCYYNTIERLKPLTILHEPLPSKSLFYNLIYNVGYGMRYYRRKALDY